jgi:hypothetical protein
VGLSQPKVGKKGLFWLAYLAKILDIFEEILFFKNDFFHKELII